MEVLFIAVFSFVFIQMSLNYQEGNKQDSYLINTPGCKIPNYDFPIKERVSKNSCGRRRIFAKRISDNKIKFKFKDPYDNCCYKYLIYKPSNTTLDLNEISLSKCKAFKNASQVTLKHDFFIVKCGPKSQPTYEDAYAFTKKKENLLNASNYEARQHQWNILVIGIDTVSRKRAESSLKGTIKYIRKEQWLDFRGYNKVGTNRYPNLMALLTGLKIKTIENRCKWSISACSQSMIWHKYKQAGYITAFGEDHISPRQPFQTNNSFIVQPTDHYMDPFFLTVEEEHLGSLCCKKINSEKQIYNYILDYVYTYQNLSYFGLFWINSFSFNIHHSPKKFDANTKTFLKELSALTAVQNNTFVIFTSDHGFRYGLHRTYAQSYYDDRLPMLFIKVPTKFIEKSPIFYSNLEKNQHRLTSPYDLHLTLNNILNTKKKVNNHIKIQGCASCRSLFHSISDERSCSQAGIEDIWCTCHEFSTMSIEEPEAQHSLTPVLAHIRHAVEGVETTNCTYCQELQLRNIVRLNNFTYSNNTYYVIAIIMRPKNIGFEAVLLKKFSRFSLVHPMQTITDWRGMGQCVKVKNPHNCAICACTTSKECLKKRRSDENARKIAAYGYSKSKE